MKLNYKEILSIIDHLSNNDMNDAVEDLINAYRENHCINRVKENLTILKDTSTRALNMLGDMEKDGKE